MGFVIVYKPMAIRFSTPTCSSETHSRRAGMPDSPPDSNGEEAWRDSSCWPATWFLKRWARSTEGAPCFCSQMDTSSASHLRGSTLSSLAAGWLGFSISRSFHPVLACSSLAFCASTAAPSIAACLAAFSRCSRSALSAFSRSSRSRFSLQLPPEGAVAAGLFVAATVSTAGSLGSLPTRAAWASMALAILSSSRCSGVRSLETNPVLTPLRVDEDEVEEEAGEEVVFCGAEKSGGVLVDEEVDEEVDAKV